LKDSFEGIWQNGTAFLEGRRFHARLSRRQLKVKAKSNNITGLEEALAREMAHAGFAAGHGAHL
jgi:hypothetical protein